MSSLRDKTILLTRSAEANEKDSRLIEARGAQSFSLPSVHFVEPDSWAACDEAIHRIRTYDAFLFTSKNAVDFFLKRVDSVNPAARTVIASRRSYAIGEKTFQGLRSAGISPAGHAGPGSAEEFVESVGKEAPGKCFLFPRSNIARDVLPSGLRALDAVVDEVVVYKTVAPEGRDLDNIRTALQNREVNAVLFFSPSAVRNFTQMIGTGHMGNITIAVIGPTTADAVQQAGLQASVIAESPTVEALLDSVETFFAKQTQKTA